MLSHPKNKLFCIELYEISKSFGVVPTEFLFNSPVDAHTRLVISRTIWEVYIKWENEQIDRAQRDAKRNVN